MLDTHNRACIYDSESGWFDRFVPSFRSPLCVANRNQQLRLYTTSEVHRNSRTVCELKYPFQLHYFPTVCGVPPLVSEHARELPDAAVMIEERCDAALPVAVRLVPAHGEGVIAIWEAQFRERYRVRYLYFCRKNAAAAVHIAARHPTASDTELLTMLDNVERIPCKQLPVSQHPASERYSEFVVPMLCCGDVLVWVVSAYDGGLCAQRISKQHDEPLSTLTLCAKVLQLEQSCHRRVVFARTLNRIYVIGLMPQLCVLDAFPTLDDVVLMAGSRLAPRLYTFASDTRALATFELDFARYEQLQKWTTRSHRFYPAVFRDVVRLLAHGCACVQSPLHVLTADVFEVIVSLLADEY